MRSLVPRTTFVESFYKKLSESRYASALCKTTCTSGHNFDKFIPKIALAMFNIMAKNYMASINDKIHASHMAQKTQKSSSDARKIAKLSSN